MRSTTRHAWRGRSIRHQAVPSTSAPHGSLLPAPGADASTNHEIRTPNGYFRHGRGHGLLPPLLGGKRFPAPGVSLTIDERREHAGAGGLAETSTNLN